MLLTLPKRRPSLFALCAPVAITALCGRACLAHASARASADVYFPLDFSAPDDGVQGLHRPATLRVADAGSTGR